MRIPHSMILVIFGASGDLCKRKLMPALYLLYKEKRVPSIFAILGVARTSYSDESFRQTMAAELRNYLSESQFDESVMQAFLKCLYYQPMNPAEENDYRLLRERLSFMDDELGNKHN